MKTCCGLFPPLVVLLLVFALSLQAGVAMAAGDERQEGAPPTGEAPPPPAANAAAPITSAGAPNAMPIGVGAAPTNNPAPSPGWGTVTAPTWEDQARLEEINRQAQIDEEWRKYRHRRPAGWVFISMGGGAFAQTYHGLLSPDSHDSDASGAPVHVSGGISAASILQLVQEAGYQFTDKFALSLQARFQYTPFSSVGWLHPPGASDPPTYALALFLRAQYALLTAGDFQLFGSGVAGFSPTGKTFLGYVERNCDMSSNGTVGPDGNQIKCPDPANHKTGHSDTVSGGPVAVGLGLGVMYHATRVFSLWTEVRVLASFGPNMWLAEFNTGLAFAFPVAPASRR